ncbi:MAG: sigma-70 family RNA polymerase sigma factor [Alphaproteobacteria bacterium]|nr:sigma-70 family RNA polymerase sigma factor [Alphaproteobacteria bacterium]
MNDGLADRTDGELVALALVGRQEAFAEIVSRHKQPLHRLIARIIGDDEEALDILQDVFVAAHGSLRRFDMARPMRAWLARIAINKARDWRRRRAVRRLISAVFPTEHAANIADDLPAIDTLAADREELRLVNAAIAILPANLRETLILRAVEGMTQAETAEVLGISAKAVETRLYRARQRLAVEIAGRR